MSSCCCCGPLLLSRRAAAAAAAAIPPPPPPFAPPGDPIAPASMETRSGSNKCWCCWEKEEEEADDALMEFRKASGAPPTRGDMSRAGGRCGGADN